MARADLSRSSARSLQQSITPALPGQIWHSACPRLGRFWCLATLAVYRSSAWSLLRLTCLSVSAASTTQVLGCSSPWLSSPQNWRLAALAQRFSAARRRLVWNGPLVDSLLDHSAAPHSGDQVLWLSALVLSSELATMAPSCRTSSGNQPPRRNVFGSQLLAPSCRPFDSRLLRCWFSHVWTQTFSFLACVCVNGIAITHSLRILATLAHAQSGAGTCSPSSALGMSSALLLWYSPSGVRPLKFSVVFDVSCSATSGLDARLLV